MMPQATGSNVLSELALWRDAGLRPVIWMRDDDAVAITPALTRLSNLAKTYDLDIALSVIPGNLAPDLAAALREGNLPFYAMCHGWKHTNHASEASPAEFGANRPQAELIADAQQARSAFAEAIGIEHPYFVPPFAQIAASLETKLKSLGFGGLSNTPGRNNQRLSRIFGRMPNLPGNPLRMLAARLGLHAQVDPVDWARGTARSNEMIAQRLIGELRLRRLGYVESSSPIGLLGHHLMHDEAIWSALESVLGLLRADATAIFPRVSGLAATYGYFSQEPCCTTAAAPLKATDQ